MRVGPRSRAPPLGNPNGVAGSAAFGSITTAGDPRVVQRAVKWLFYSNDPGDQRRDRKGAEFRREHLYKKHLVHNNT